jgi:PAS domain S-box-containing protein
MNLGVGAKDALLASVMRASLDCIVVVDDDSRVLEWNPAAERTFGWSREEALGRSIADMIVPHEHHAAHHAGMARYLAGGEPRVLNQRIEVDARCKDGRRIPVELAITEVQEGGRRLFTASLRDLTELRQARRALEESEAKLSAFFQHAPAAMFIKSRDGIYERVNEFTGVLMGRPASDILGKRAADVFPPDTAALADGIDRKVLESGQSQVVEAAYDVGQIKHTVTARFPIRSAEGDLTHVGVVIVDISDRVAAERLLQDSERRMAAFLDHAPMAMYLKDREGRYFIANRFMAERLGRSVEELKTLTPRDVLTPESYAESQEVDAEIVATRQPHVRTSEFQTVSGVISALTVRFPVYGDDGEIAYIGGVILDTTAETRAQKKVRALSNHHPVAMLIVGAEDHRIKLANPAFFGLIGLPADSDTALVSESRWMETEEEEAAFRAAIRAQSERDGYECRMRRVGGHFWASISWRQVDYDGERALVFSALDISARKEAERLRLESEARLKAFVEHAPLTMFLKDADGRYVLANEQTARNLGTSVEAMIGRTTAEIAPAEVAEAARVAEAEVLANGRPRTDTQVFDLPSGRVHGLNTRFPIPDASGALTQIGGVFVDITAQKEAEEELQRSREALLQSEKMNALGSLLAGVSHELNNPLAIVVGESILLEEEAEGSALADSAARIKRAAERCSRIVQTFLAMARQKEPERRRVSAAELVGSALELAEYGLRSNGIEVVRRFDPDLPDIWADPDQVVQVILNLLVNAQQALQTVAAPRCLTLSLGHGTAGRIRFEVQDNGPGVAENLSRRIFDPFFTTKPQGTGTGIGLSFSQGIAEAHEGSLQLVGAGGPGATFRLELPIARSEEQAAITSAVAEPGPARRRVLVVDDEPELAETLCRLLRSDGLDVELAVGGAEAQRRLEREDFDMVLSDLRMPDVDGPTLHAWLRERRPDLQDRIGFITGDTLGPAAVGFLRQSGRPFLEKPFTRAGIRRLLAALDGAKLDQAS